MRYPQKGDLILHLYNSELQKGDKETYLCGYSFVLSPCRIVSEKPSIPGIWEDLFPYYRINLERYTPFTTPLPFSTIVRDYALEIRKEITEDRPKYYPFNTYGEIIRTVQGIYLARCTNRLYNLFLEILNIQTSIEEIPPNQPTVHSEYSEAKRLASERYFFARNPSLVKAAKNKHGGVCEVCKFDFYLVYGDLGEGFIEAHHKKPLSERPEAEWSEELKSCVDDIAVLCSNCHRMIHRKKPALTVDQLREILELNKK